MSEERNEKHAREDFKRRREIRAKIKRRHANKRARLRAKRRRER